MCTHVAALREAMSGPSKARATGSFEPSDVSAGNPTLVLCKSNIGSKHPSCLFGHKKPGKTDKSENSFPNLYFTPKISK